MNTLIFGMVIFYGIHLLAFTAVSPAAKKRLGENVYKALFSLISIAGLVIMIYGFKLTRQGPEAARIIYDPPAWAFTATKIFVLAGFISLMVSLHKGRLKGWLKNPMSIGIALWAIGHLISNGSVGEVTFFGGFLALAAVDIIISTARGKTPSYTVKRAHDIIAPVAGVIVFAVIMWLHPMLFGASVY